MLIEALDLIAASAPIRAVRGSVLLYPLLSAAHIAGFGLLFGAIATWDVALLRGRQPDALALRLARIGAVVAVLSGLFLFLCRGSYYLGNPAFQVKAVLLLLALGNVLWAHLRMGAADLRGNAALSVGLWASVLVAGRYIGFV